MNFGRLTEQDLTLWIYAQGGDGIIEKTKFYFKYRVHDGSRFGDGRTKIMNWTANITDEDRAKVRAYLIRRKEMLEKAAKNGDKLAQYVVSGGSYWD